MEKKKMVIVLMAMVVLVISANMKGVKSDAADCYDGCSTACVSYFPDSRRMVRCDRKCQIRCSPGLEEANGGSK